MKVNSTSGPHAVTASERAKLIARLQARGLTNTQATNLFDAGARHADYLKYWTDAELLAVANIGPATVTTIRTATGAYRPLQTEGVI